MPWNTLTLGANAFCDKYLTNTCPTWSCVKRHNKNRHNLVPFFPFHHSVFRRQLPAPRIRLILLLMRTQPFVCVHRVDGGRGRGAAAVWAGDRPGGNGTSWTAAAPPKHRRGASWGGTAVGGARQSVFGVSCCRRRWCSSSCCTLIVLLRGRNLLPVQQRSSIWPLHHPVSRRSRLVSQSRRGLLMMSQPTGTRIHPWITSGISKQFPHCPKLWKTFVPNFVL